MVPFNLCHHREKDEAGDSQASKWKLPNAAEPGNFSCLLEEWGHTGQSWLGAYTKVHQLIGMRVQGTLRVTEESIFFHLSPSYCKNAEEWMIVLYYKLTNAFFKPQNPWVTGSVPVNWNLTNYTTQWPEWTWQDLDSLTFSQTILGHSWGAHYQRPGTIHNKKSACTLCFGRRETLIAWMQQFSHLLLSIPKNGPRYS